MTNIAKKTAQLRQSTNEKKYYTLQLLESAFMLGSEVTITPVRNYKLDYKSGEKFEYKEPVDTYVIFDERPKVSLLQRLGWYREGQDTPIIAYIPTHLLYSKKTNKVVNETTLYNKKFKSIIVGTDREYELKPIVITRGAIIDIKYDFVENTDNKFYVANSKIDTVSLQYVAALVPYKHDAESVSSEDSLNSEYINFEADQFGI